MVFGKFQKCILPKGMAQGYTKWDFLDEWGVFKIGLNTEDYEFLK